MHSVVHVNLHCRVASSHLHRPRANVERDVHFKKELDFLIYMRRLAAGVKPCQTTTERSCPQTPSQPVIVRSGSSFKAGQEDGIRGRKEAGSMPNTGNRWMAETPSALQ